MPPIESHQRPPSEDPQRSIAELVVVLRDTRQEYQTRLDALRRLTGGAKPKDLDEVPDGGIERIARTFRLDSGDYDIPDEIESAIAGILHVLADPSEDYRLRTAIPCALGRLLDAGFCQEKIDEITRACEAGLLDSTISASVWDAVESSDILEVSDQSKIAAINSAVECVTRAHLAPDSLAQQETVSEAVMVLGHAAKGQFGYAEGDRELPKLRSAALAALLLASRMSNPEVVMGSVAAMQYFDDKAVAGRFIELLGEPHPESMKMHLCDLLIERRDQAGPFAGSLKALASDIAIPMSLKQQLRNLATTVDPMTDSECVVAQRACQGDDRTFLEYLSGCSASMITLLPAQRHFIARSLKAAFDGRIDSDAWQREYKPSLEVIRVLDYLARGPGNELDGNLKRLVSRVVDRYCEMFCAHKPPGDFRERVIFHTAQLFYGGSQGDLRQVFKSRVRTEN